MYPRRSLAIFFGALIGIAAPAGATTITTTTALGSSGWVSTITNGSAVDIFGSLQNHQNYSTSTGVSLSAGSSSPVFVFTGPDNSGWNLTSNTYTSGSSYTALYGASDGIGNITATMPSGGVNAVLLEVATSGGSKITVKLSDGESFTPSPGIFGLSISHDISWLTVSTTSGSEPILYDFEYGNSNLTQDQFTQAPAPSLEATTMLMIGGGLLILVGGRRKLFG